MQVLLDLLMTNGRDKRGRLLTLLRHIFSITYVYGLLGVAEDRVFQHAHAGALLGGFTGLVIVDLLTSKAMRVKDRMSIPRELRTLGPLLSAALAVGLCGLVWCSLAQHGSINGGQLETYTLFSVAGLVGLVVVRTYIVRYQARQQAKSMQSINHTQGA